MSKPGDFGHGIPNIGGKVNSASDQRTINNILRHEYRVLSDAEKKWMKDIKDKGLELHEFIGSRFEGRVDSETRIAQERVREAVMWAINSLTK